MLRQRPEFTKPIPCLRVPAAPGALMWFGLCQTLVEPKFQSIRLHSKVLLLCNYMLGLLLRLFVNCDKLGLRLYAGDKTLLLPLPLSSASRWVGTTLSPKHKASPCWLAFDVRQQLNDAKKSSCAPSDINYSTFTSGDVSPM